MRTTYRLWLSVASALFIIVSSTSCSDTDKKFDKTPQLSTPQDTVNLPVVSLPEGADTTNAYWQGIDLEPKKPVIPLPVNEEKARFLLQPGYSLEPILTEPQIQQPGAITFDGNGRMYVLELRTYMLTADSEGTLEPVSAISRWEDKNNDGVYETGGTFVDSLVFPRFVLAFGPNSVLTMESNTDNVYMFTDTDNDGKADKKEFFTDNFGRPGNVEHQQAFLYWGMDNWLYSTVNPFRVRWTPNGVIREATGSNHAQWGISHDDDGKLWFQGGSNGLPMSFQFPIHYGDYIVKDVNYAEGFDVPWGAPVKIADMQGGMGAVRMPEGTLNRVTGAAGNDVYRGDRLPKELYGQYFYGEPVARIVRQINPVVNEGLTTLHNVFQDQKSEFIRSTDPLFRPVDMTTAPDGTMYITDMYHGIIQEGEWTPVGSYLRAKIEQYQLDKVVGLGRIWRLNHQDFQRDKTKPKMYDQKSSELLAYLSHPNGWWRDMAQQVLVQRQDKSVAPELVKLAKTSNNLLARFHALWVLEGIGALDAGLVREMMKDSNPRMRIQAMWVGETLYKAGDMSLGADYVRMMNDEDTMVKMRAMMTGRLLKIPGTEKAVKTVMAADQTAGVQLVGQQVLEPVVVNSFFGRSNPNYSEKEQALLEKGADIFNSLCSTCHGTLGLGAPGGRGKLMAPSLAASKRIKGHPDYVIKTLLHGMTGDIEGTSYTGVMMAPMGNNDDEWIAAAASFIRANFENESSLVTAEDVARVRANTTGQTKSYTYPELLASVPKVLTPTDGWKMTASHTANTRKGSTASAKGAFNFEGWTTGITQQAGMWYQVQLPKPATITEIHFTSPPISRGWRPGSPPPIHTYPKEYDLEVSMDGKQWTKLLENAKGDNASMAIRIDPVETKFLRMTLTKSDSVVHGEFRGKPIDFEVTWTMREMKLYGFME
ncbi:discoidin domain-containing protein [Imperialibacter roseus]|uniref:Discoidin domain-containing protein n=1 Tax=Imperialibacter roseus TaxID=1324217 RepID=A0ABZ0IRB4_9BACT|nr:discoidin domain-containing protein [Imperialibacter roseus]WOK06261.1 discoidin domain-containing protein [Imperialibacter roseus]